MVDNTYTENDPARYNVFTRTWWKPNPKWPNGREPHPGRKRYLARNVSWSEARRIAEDYNDTPLTRPDVA